MIIIEGADLHGNESFCRTLYLTDGGVYDNMGLETIWSYYDTVLVSDAGAPMAAEERVQTSWLGQAPCAIDVATNHSRGLRNRALIDDFRQGERKDTYWGIKTDIQDYRVADSLRCDPTTGL